MLRAVGVVVVAFRCFCRVALLQLLRRAVVVVVVVVVVVAVCCVAFLRRVAVALTVACERFGVFRLG
eukprot:1696156-Lingulodinium_polyedra.AAC.1